MEALRNLAERTGVDDIRSLVGTLIQTDRFGTSGAGPARSFRLLAHRAPPARRRTGRQNHREDDHSSRIVCDALPDFRHRRTSRDSVAAHIQEVKLLSH